MNKYRIETDINGFIERWLERTPDYDDFVPAGVIWEAMLHSAGLSPERRHVWGMNRNSAMRCMRRSMDLTAQRMRYYRSPIHVPGMPRGFIAPCYERLRLSEYAVKALDAPMIVRPKTRKRQMARV